MNLEKLHSREFAGKLPMRLLVQLTNRQEGRMRGQAFVTFPSVELAQQGLVRTIFRNRSVYEPLYSGFVLLTLPACKMQNLVNGYMFKGKPMIVQFGRNPSAGRQDE